MQTILVTGGAGYVGSHAAKTFSKSGYRVIVLDNLTRGHREFAKWGEFIEGDICDTSVLDRIFSENQIDIISHFAAFAYVGESSGEPQKYYENNVSKALTLLDRAVRNNVRVFQFSSSSAVYGEHEKYPLTEGHNCKPISPYGRTKYFFEEMLKDFSNAHQLRYSILRYFNAAGADPEGEIGEDHFPETHLIPIVLDCALKRRKEVEIFGDDYDTPDGTCIRDYIHVTDLARAHLLVLRKTFESDTDTLYNLGNGNGFSVKEVIETARNVTGKEIHVKAVKRRSGDPSRLVSSAKKLGKETGFEPLFTSLENIIETAWNWHKKRFGQTN